MIIYDLLFWLHPSQVWYCDTDSVIFLYDETNLLHKKPTNDQELPETIVFAPNKEASLGQWENEFKSDEWIEELETD